MKYIQGLNRNQLVLFPTSLDDVIEQDNDVRLIDLFVESLNIENIGFRSNYIENGRPAYHPKDLLKLYIYGYLNSIRSSRKLEKASHVNIEVIWLLKGLNPDHNTISNFRKDNPKAIKKVFRSTVQIARNFELIGAKLIAGDSSKFRAQNSKKNNFNEKKIERHLAYIENKLKEYEHELEHADSEGELTDIERNKKSDTIKKEIAKQHIRKENYKKLKKQLDETGQSQISTSDPESRQLITRNNITEVVYNVQSSVDAKNNIPIDYKVSNNNDSKAMGPMLRRAKTILRTNDFTALYDKGYHTGSEFETAEKLGIDVLVAVPKVATQAPDTAYNVENFIYNKEKDQYICPQGNVMTTPGTWHQTRTYRFKRYTTKACVNCPIKAHCSKARRGKAIQRSEYQDVIDKNKQRIQKYRDHYRRRQAIVEHPYGTIKRQWGFDYIITKKSIQRAESDIGLMFIAYNLKRLLNILGKNKFMKYLNDCIALYLCKLRSLLLKIQGYQKFKFSLAN